MMKQIWLSVFVLLGTVIVFAPLPRSASTPAEKLVHIEASQFSYSPGEIRVNTGDLVTLELASTDVVHGLYVNGYDVSVTADPGQTQRVTFRADHPGAYRFRCNVTCGAMHPFMIGRLTVGGNDWLLRTIGLALIAAICIIFMPQGAG